MIAGKQESFGMVSELLGG